MRRATWLFATGFTLVVGIVAMVLVLLAQGRFIWGPPEIPKAQCEALVEAAVASNMETGSGGVYRERVAGAIIREPQNTWSNLAFVFVGALVWIHDYRTFARLLGASLVALGIASGLYHASLLPWIRTIDVAAMGWVSFALCCHGFNCVTSGSTPDQMTSGSRSRGEWWIGLIGGALAVTAAFLRNHVRISGVKPFDTTYTTIAGIADVFALAVIGILYAIRARPSVRPPISRLGLVAVVVALGVYCQLNDRVGCCLCAPNGAVQGHALWHVLMALAVALTYNLFALISGRPGMGSHTR